MRGHRLRHRNVPFFERSAIFRRWVTDIRACCALLTDMNSATVAGVSLTLPLGHAPGKALALMRYGEQLAHEHGLYTRRELQDGTLTLWLDRGHDALSPAQRVGSG